LTAPKRNLAPGRPPTETVTSWTTLPTDPPKPDRAAALAALQTVLDDPVRAEKKAAAAAAAKALAECEFLRLQRAHAAAVQAAHGAEVEWTNRKRVAESAVLAAAPPELVRLESQVEKRRADLSNFCIRLFAGNGRHTVAEGEDFNRRKAVLDAAEALVRKTKFDLDPAAGIEQIKKLLLEEFA
jgi:hypothetical protein